MVTAAAHGNGKTHLLLGLSAANLQLLREGKPIRLSRESHGVAIPENTVIVIVFGETEEAIATELVRAGLITDDTVVNQRRSM